MQTELVIHHRWTVARVRKNVIALAKEVRAHVAEELAISVLRIYRIKLEVIKPARARRKLAILQLRVFYR